MSNSGKMLIAVRQDGLGPRLGALTNARRLAGGIEWRHGFIWPSAEGVPSAEALFEPEYVSGHLVIDYNPSEFAAMPGGALRDTTIDSVAEDPAFRGIAITRGGDQIGLFIKRPIKLGRTLAAVLYELPFLPHVREAMDRVRGALMPDTVAVEVWRDAPAAEFVPAAILRHRIDALKAADKRVVLVGDDEALIASLRDAFDVPVAADLAESDDPAARAMANIAALVRSREVVGGGTAVAQVVKAMDDKKAIISAIESFPQEELALVIHRDLAAQADAVAAAPTHYFLAGILPKGSDEQIAALEAAHRGDPANLSYARALVRPMIERGRLEEAEALIRQTAEQTFLASGKRVTGMAGLFGKDDMKEEARLLAEACVAHPGPYLHAQLSAMLHDLGSFERAYAAARQAFTLDPASALLALRLGEQAFRARHHEVAKQAFSQAAVDAPDSALAQIGLADALIAQGNHNQAFECLSKAVELDPENAVYIARLAYWEESRGNADVADTLIMRASAIAPGDADVLGIVSRIYEMRKDFGQAIRTLQSVDTSVKELRGMKVREKVLRKAIREGQIYQKRAEDAEKKKARTASHLEIEGSGKTNLLVIVQDALSKWWSGGKKGSGDGKA